MIESRFIGGMGAEDALPFADKAQAEAFAAKNGGGDTARRLACREIPQTDATEAPHQAHALVGGAR